MRHFPTPWIATGWMIASLLLGCARQSHSASRAPSASTEGPITSFLGTPRFEQQTLFEKDRFPNVVVTRQGTVLAFWNGVIVRRSEDGGVHWNDPIPVGKGFMGGGVIADQRTGAVIAFLEETHPPAPLSLYRSTDDAKSWQRQEHVLKPNRDGHVPSMHMNEHGITLRHGPYAGRLLRTSRWYAGKNDKEHHPLHYTDAIFSDDGGHSWQTSEPFPAMGTGEAAVAELSDGRIYYNSRRHWAPQGVNPRRRWVGWSRDGGEHWIDVAICNVLPDGDQDRDYGLMGGLVRLPIRGRDVLLFSNIESPSGRHGGTIWASFDGGKTWPVKRRVTEGAFAYSSLDAGRPGTPSEGWIYLLYEGGANNGTLARFNLAWVLGGQPTGDGSIPGHL